MAGESTYGTMSTLFGNVYDLAILTAREYNGMLPLVTVKGDLSDSRPRIWATYTGGTFDALDENTDGTAQAFHASAAGTLTPSEYFQQVFLTDKRIRTDPMDAQREAGLHLGQTAAEHIDKTLVGLFSSFTGGTVGAGSAALTFANVMLASAKLRTNKAMSGYVCVVHPVQWYRMTAATADVPTLLQNNQTFMDSALRPFYQGSYSGIDFLVNANIAAGSASVGGLFVQEAITLDMRNPFHIEPERNASLRGWELNAGMEYGAGVVRPTFGIQLLGMGTI